RVKGPPPGRPNPPPELLPRRGLSNGAGCARDSVSAPAARPENKGGTAEAPLSPFGEGGVVIFPGGAAMLADRTVAIIGAGSMAEALLRGVFGAGVLSPDRCIVTNESNDERLERVAGAWNVRTTRDKVCLMADSDMIVL